MAFFEGSEKKLEIVVSPHLKLRERGPDFWNRVVQVAGAHVLSKIENRQMAAWLLSESGLFVWGDRILMITCGRTRLIESALFLIDQFGVDAIVSLIYQRKNEFFAKEQPTSFLEDVRQLKSHVPGKAMRFGEMHGHHNLIFHLDRDYTPKKEDRTLEVLMYDISDASSRFLHSGKKSPEEVARLLGLEELLSGHQVDAHCFEPCGHSLNAIMEDVYYTIHITPERGQSYVSVETNNLEQADRVVDCLLERLDPNAFDIISFNFDQKSFPPSYLRKFLFKERLSIGYDVMFAHYFKKPDNIERPFYF